MLDVHPPEHTPHTWRDFLIHIATIVVGLLIAVGLEQSVEYLHHRQERIELRDSLSADTERTIADSEQQRKNMAAALQWLNGRIGQVQDALENNHPLAPALPESNNFQGALPDDPAWKAARNSGLIELLPQDDIKIYSEIDTVISALMQLVPPSQVALQARTEFEWRFLHSGSTMPDFSRANRADMEEYLHLLLAIKSNTLEFDTVCAELLGAERAVIRGEKDLSRIHQAEVNGI